MICLAGQQLVQLGLWALLHVPKGYSKDFPTKFTISMIMRMSGIHVGISEETAVPQCIPGIVTRKFSNYLTG